MAVADPTLGPDELELLRRRVLNVVGHELRTPVTTLRGLAERLSTETDEAARAELTDAVRRNAVRLERLVDDLLVAAGVSTALPVDDTESTAVAAAAQRAWHEVAGDEPLAIEGDATVAVSALTLSRVLGPLLDNARRYGTGPVQVRISSAAGTVTVEVVSPGGVLSPTDAALACEPFYRGEAAVPVASGLGLGLPVARGLARQRGGDVTLAAAPEGAVTRLELPSAP